MEREPMHGPGAKARPVHELRLGGIKAAIWRNETETGVRYNSTFERVYRDGETWRSTSSFGRDDLLLLSKLADQTHTWIMNRGRDGAGPQGQAPDRPLEGSEMPRRDAS